MPLPVLPGNKRDVQALAQTIASRDLAYTADVLVLPERKTVHGHRHAKSREVRRMARDSRCAKLVVISRHRRPRPAAGHPQ